MTAQGGGLSFDAADEQLLSALLKLVALTVDSVHMTHSGKYNVRLRQRFNKWDSYGAGV